MPRSRPTHPSAPLSLLLPLLSSFLTASLPCPFPSDSWLSFQSWPPFFLQPCTP